MAICKDCLHVEVCSAYLLELYKRAHLLAPDPEVIRNFKCDDCKNFKDRSRFVELPCKVGDSYFEIEQYCTERGYYTEPQHTDTVDCEYCDVDGVCDRQYRITEKRFVSLIQIFEYKEKAADKYNRKFLTKEEAEQALKERKENGSL